MYKYAVQRFTTCLHKVIRKLLSTMDNNCKLPPPHRKKSCARYCTFVHGITWARLKIIAEIQKQIVHRSDKNELDTSVCLGPRSTATRRTATPPRPRYTRKHTFWLCRYIMVRAIYICSVWTYSPDGGGGGEGDKETGITSVFNGNKPAKSYF